MAAIYLHDTKHAQGSPETSTTVEHSRQLSTLSSATLHTTTSHSHPSEPLLPPPIAGADEATLAYYEQLSRQPRNSDGSPAHLRWDDPPTLRTNTSTDLNHEKGNTPNQGRRKPWRRRRRVKFALQIVLAAWAIYNTVRYFMAFALYDHGSHLGQILSLTLGICTGVSFALALIFVIIKSLTNKMVNFGIVYRSITRLCSFLHYSSSALLLSPSVVNLVMLFLWRNSANQDYGLRYRCHFDIDVIWSVTKNHCNGASPLWAIWIVVSALRIVLTLIILVVYHTLAFLYPEVSRRPMHQRLRSGSVSFTPAPSIRQSRRRSSNSISPHDNHQPLHQHISEISLDGATLRGESSRSLDRIRLARSRSSGLSGESNTVEGIPFKRKNSDSESDHDPSSQHPDRFRSILSQIAQETEEALEYARSENSSLHDNALNDTYPPPHVEAQSQPFSRDDHNDESDDDDDDVNVQFYGHNDNIYNIYNLRPIPPTLGYNEFGLPYPPEQDIRVLGGYVRRMPTIESMGSGEISSSIGASSLYRGDSVHTSSRPPTRNTLLSFSSAEYELGSPNSSTLSRANSLSARAELLVGFSTTPGAGTTTTTTTSEHGELMTGRPEMMRRLSNSASLLSETLSTGVIHECQSSTAGSRATASTASYHTATMASTGASYFPPYPASEPPRRPPHVDDLGR